MRRALAELRLKEMTTKQGAESNMLITERPSECVPGGDITDELLEPGISPEAPCCHKALLMGCSLAQGLTPSSLKSLVDDVAHAVGQDGAVRRRICPVRVRRCR